MKKKKNLLKKSVKKVIKKVTPKKKLPRKILIRKTVKKLSSKKRTASAILPKKKNQEKKKSLTKNIRKALPKKKAIIVKKKKGKLALVKKSTPAEKKLSSVTGKVELKKMAPVSANAFLAENLFKAKIKVIGVGGGGTSIVADISRSLDKATFVVADTDTRGFGRQKGVKYFLFGQDQTHGLGTGLNPELATHAAEIEKDKIAGLFQNQDIVIFIASLGGGVGSGATKVFAEVSKNSGAITLGIFTLPFKFEGAQKYKIAMKSLKELRQSLNVSITIPNERIFKVIDANTPIVEAFSKVNKQLIEGLESLIDLIYNPGLINIDFADVKAILKGKGSEAFLNTAEASGKDRAEKIIKDILHNHLYQQNNFIPEKVLLNIVGSDNLSMFEVDRISKAVAEKNPKAKIIFGISKNTKYNNKIKATLLMTGPGGEEEPGKPEPKTVEKTKVAKVAVKKEKPVVKIANKESIVEKKEVAVNFIDSLLPKSSEEKSSVAMFASAPVTLTPKKAVIDEAVDKTKKTIRRNALEIKRAQELEEEKKSLQEKEWEIPAFLRIKK